MKYKKRKYSKRYHKRTKRILRSKRYSRKTMTKKKRHSQRKVKRNHRIKFGAGEREGGSERIVDITDTEVVPGATLPLPNPVAYSESSIVDPLAEVVDMVFEQLEDGSYRIPPNKVALVSAHGEGLDNYTVVPEGITIIFAHGSGIGHNVLPYQKYNYEEGVQLDYKGHSIYPPGSLIQDYLLQMNPFYPQDSGEKDRMFTYRGLLDLSLEWQDSIPPSHTEMAPIQVDAASEYKNEMLAVELLNKEYNNSGLHVKFKFYEPTGAGRQEFMEAIKQTIKIEEIIADICEISLRVADLDFSCILHDCDSFFGNDCRKAFYRMADSVSLVSHLNEIIEIIKQQDFTNTLFAKYRFGKGYLYAVFFVEPVATPREIADAEIRTTLSQKYKTLSDLLIELATTVDFGERNLYERDDEDDIIAKYLLRNNENVYKNTELQLQLDWRTGRMLFKEIKLSELFHRLHTQQTDGVSVPSVLVGNFCRSGNIQDISTIVSKCRKSEPDLSYYFQETRFHASRKTSNEEPDLLRTKSLANNLTTRNFREIQTFVLQCIGYQGGEETWKEEMKQMIKSKLSMSESVEYTTEELCRILYIYIEYLSIYSNELVREVPVLHKRIKGGGRHGKRR